MWDRAEGHEGVTSRVPSVTLLAAIVELWRHGGHYELLRWQWGLFTAILKKDDVKNSVSLNQPETFVSLFHLLQMVSLMFVLVARFLQLFCHQLFCSHVFPVNRPSFVECCMTVFFVL